MSDYEDEYEDDIDLSEIGGPIKSAEFGPVEYEEPDEYTEGGDYDDNSVGGRDVQFMLLSYLSSSHQLWIKCVPILKEEYFDQDYQPVVKMLKEFERRNQILPDKLIIRSDTGVRLDKPEDADHPSIIEELADRVGEFCRFSALERFLLEAVDIISTDKSRGTMSHLSTEMEKIASISAQQNLGYEVHDDVEELLKKGETADGLPTGFDFLDASLNGGVTKPSFNLVSAASGQGKSIYLQNQAINYARQGHNVIYISLELPEFMIEKRMVAMMTGIGINAIYQNLDAAILKMKRAKRREGKIQIKRMPMSGVTVADIRAYTNELIASTGEVWDHIMIDYMDLMSPMSASIREDNIHLRDKAIATELYDWTHDKVSNKVIWSASQQVKGAKDEKSARQSGVAGGVGKVHNCDNLIILKRTLEDIQEERCWGFVEKGRNGGQGTQIPFHWHNETQRLSNPVELEELFLEANQPGAKEEQRDKQKSKRSNDPMVKAALTPATPAETAAANTRKLIMKNRGKRNG